MTATRREGASELHERHDSVFKERRSNSFGKVSFALILGGCVLTGVVSFLFLEEPSAVNIATSSTEPKLESPDEASAITNPSPAVERFALPATKRVIAISDRQIPSDADPFKTDKGASNLVIRTRHKQTGLPIAAYVELNTTLFDSASELDPAQSQSRVLQTDSSGIVEVRVPPGSTSGLAWAEASISSEVQVEITDADGRSTLDLELSPGGVVFGRVLSDPEGTAIEGAEIFVPVVSEWKIAISSSDGSFRFDGFPADGFEMQLESRAPGHGEGFAQISFETDGAWVVASDGYSIEERRGTAGTSPQVTLLMPREGFLRGQVVSLDQNPIVGATVIAEGYYMISKRIGSPDSATATTDKGGFFELEDLRLGISHSVQVRADGFAQLLEFVAASSKPQLNLGTMTLDPESIVHGAIVEEGGAPAMGVVVELVHLHGTPRSYVNANPEHVMQPDFPGQDALWDTLQSGGSAKTNDRGEYEIRGLPEGSFVLTVHCDEGGKLHEEEIQIVRGFRSQQNITLPVSSLLADG